jgi:hypothetical protein
MGTRATLLIRDNDGKPLVKIYRQCDGSFYMMGREIIEFIRKGKFSSSYPVSSKMGETFESMGDLAVQLMAHFKRPHTTWNSKKKIQTPGNFSVIQLDDYNESFHYDLSVKDGQLYLKANGYEIRDGFEDEGISGEFQLYPLTEKSAKLTGVIG